MRLRYLAAPRTRHVALGCPLIFAAALTPAAAAPQSHAPSSVRSPVVAVLPFTLGGDSAHADTSAIEHGIAALLEGQLATERRVRIARIGRTPPAAPSISPATAAAAAARANGASFAVLGTVVRVGDSVRVEAQVVRVRDTLSRPLDEFTATLDQIPALVEDLADAVADSIAPRKNTTRGGGPLFRPPRPSVPFAAITLYSKAVSARAAGDADTAVKLLRQASSLAPQWEQPKRELSALKRRT